MLTMCQALWCTLGPDHVGVQELDTNSLVLKRRIETSTKLKYRVREGLDQLLLGGYTVRGKRARAGRRKPVSYWIQMKGIKLTSFRFVGLKKVKKYKHRCYSTCTKVSLLHLPKVGISKSFIRNDWNRKKIIVSCLRGQVEEKFDNIFPDIWKSHLG